MKIRVFIVPKPDLLDPQGEAINASLLNLGFPEVKSVRQGKTIDLELSELDFKVAFARVEEMCEKLLANSIIENYYMEEL
tara:strand:+ start:335 stop:574 length:240 start_codon:yes stop_codon:yes gene_type:complete